MGYTAKLKRGAKSIDLTTNGYSVLGDFVPPTVSEVIQTAGGTSANKRGGASRTGSRAVNAPFSFGLKVEGGSAGEVQALVDNVDYFLRQAGNESDPTYLEWRPDNNVSFEPLWGQWGASRRVEIVSGSVYYPANYLVGTLRERGLVGVRVDLEVKPYALGMAQRLATAAGGILEDTIGSPDGRPRGTLIPEATTNKMTNPVFGNATFDTGWTATDAVASKNTDPRYKLFGNASAKITSTSSGGVFTQSINVGNTNYHTFSAYIRKLDGSAIDETDAKIWYNGDLVVTTHTPLGNGWYRMCATVAGINAATNTGVFIVGANATIYLAGYQAEEKTYATPLAYGDLAGCAWTGTAHASTSTRTAASCKVLAANILDNAEGTAVLVWKVPFDSVIPSGSIQLWSNGNSDSLRANYDGSDDKIYFTDNTNVIATAAQTFMAGNIIVLHFTWGPSGLNIFKNGANAATGATYTPPTLTSYLWLGTTESTTTHCGGTFLGFMTYSTAMTTAQVLADYTNIYQRATAGDGYGQRISGIPWLWTIGGDDVIDNYSDATHADYAYIAGVDGSAEAPITGTMDNGGTAASAFAMAVMPVSYAAKFAGGGDFYDLNTSGTAWTGALSGTVMPLSVTTTATFFTDFYLNVTGQWALEFDGAPYMLRCTLADLGTALYARSEESVGDIYSPWRVRTIGTALTALYVAGDLPVFPSNSPIVLSQTYNLYLGVKRASGTANAYLDYMRVMPGNFTYVDIGITDLVFADNGIWDSTGLTTVNRRNTFQASPMELYPNAYNYLTFGLDAAGEASNIDRTVTLALNVLPKWTIA